MFQNLITTIESISKTTLSEERKEVVQPLIEYIQTKIDTQQPIRLNFICTHNSRRSHLLKTESCICGDIVNELPLAQPTVSQHLKELKNAGLIKGSIEGTSICYCLNEQGFNQLKSFFEIVNTYLTSKECC